MDRERRAVVVGAAGALAGIAGCSAREQPLTVERVWFPDGGDADGRFAVRATVKNPRSARVSATAYLYATVGGDHYVRERDVTVPAGGTATATASFPMSYADAAKQSVGAHADVVEQ